MDIVQVAEAIDTLVSSDVSVRGIVRDLYVAARQVIPRPLSLVAAEIPRSAIQQPGEVVIVSTGATCQRIGVDPGLGETDGPAGAVVLARALGRGLRAVPLLLTERTQVDSLKQVALAAGLTTTDLTGAAQQATTFAYNASVIVQGFPDRDDEAKAEAARILREVKPRAIVTIERSGMNEVGVYHNSAGRDTSHLKARVDYLVEAAAGADIPTIGIGDAGTEIGMGLIADAVRRHTKFGEKCACPCGRGLVPRTKTDTVILATVSNWGAYGICAVLAVLLNDPSVLHTPAMEERIIARSADAGYLDGTGYTDVSVDGLPGDVHAAIVRLLRSIVDRPFVRLERSGFGGGIEVRGQGRSHIRDPRRVD
jgi:hypothetical protein